MTEPIKLPPLPEGWETELLDWVSACQSAYHIDNTPGHRFGGLGSNLEENRSEIICFVRGLIESHAAAAIEADRQTRGEAVAYRLLRKNADGEWVTDGRPWCDGVPDAELVKDSEKREQYRIEYAFADPQPAEPSRGEPVAEITVNKDRSQTWVALKTQWLPEGKHLLYTAPQPQQLASEPKGTVYWLNASPTVAWVGRPPDDGEHIYTTPQPQQIPEDFVDELAQEIRRVDGNHSLGAAALAERLVPFLSRTLFEAAPEVKP